MVDILDPSKRSELMARIRSKDTKPELIVRKLIFGNGYRYRLHRKNLPGKPDLVFVGRRKVIFVHGCFWHAHQNCKVARFPETRKEYWREKLLANRRRDEKNEAELIAQGWQVLTLWECELSKVGLWERIKAFLD